MKLHIDPPSGWKYGFPKPVPEGFEDMTYQQKVDWFVSEGYPKELLGEEVFSCRFFSKEDG